MSTRRGRGSSSRHSNSSSFRPSCLRTITQKRLFKAIDAITQADNVETPNMRWCVLVVDEFWKRIISSITTTNELTKHQISHIEPLTLFNLGKDEAARKPFPGLEAIYMLESSVAEGFVTMVTDFEEEPMYSKVHLLLSGAVEEENLQVLARGKVAQHIETCVELNIEYAPIDSHAFILSSMDFSEEYVYRDLYGDQRERTNLIEHAASGLFTMIASLGSSPQSIRWMMANSPNGSRPNTADAPHTYDVAAELAQRVGQKLRDAKEWTEPLPSSEGTNVLVLDRSFDLKTVLLDHYHCGSLLMDHSELQVGNMQYKIEAFDDAQFGVFRSQAVGEDGQPAGPAKVLQLIETNKVWNQLRFQSLSGRAFGESCKLVQKEITDRYPNAAKLVTWERNKSEDMKNLSAAAQKKVRKLGIRELQAYNESVRTLTSTKEMVMAILLGPDSQTAEEKQARLHKRMYNLQYQQAVAMGKYDGFELNTLEGPVETTARNHLKTILTNTELSENVRIRMFLLYALASKGDVDADLLSHDTAGVEYRLFWAWLQNIHRHDWDESLPTNQIPAVRSLEDHTMLHTPVFKEVMANGNGMLVPHHLTANTEQDQELRDEFLHQASLFNAFTPTIRDLSSALLQGTLDEAACPFLPSFRSSESAVKPKPKKSWYSRRGGGNSSTNLAASGPLIIFVLGGITHAEIQSIYELIAKFGVNIYIGGTHMTSPTSFVDTGLMSFGSSEP
eukprot:TRINITY_DN1114_c0_g1_i11.p1 TRINITY_DN1114_c0_g1~~TRINITY_DN1114_c0_g1_i11.p1  ORF type:complete len:731 (+),score=218.05 TRINITY_DN1114_c0_g1_i11:178-2370(+)